MATVKRATPTHPTVYVGLALAAVGLVLAMYAYTGTRQYDITYAFVAIGGGLLALAGIFTAAWGRAIMSVRAQRARRAAHPVEPAKGAEVRAPPTVAAPQQKKRFDLGNAAMKAFKRRRDHEGAKPHEEKAASHQTAFAFRRRNAPAPPPSVDEPEETRAAPAPALDPAAPARLTLQCPRCAASFSAEGVRPLTVLCPSCGFSDTV